MTSNFCRTSTAVTVGSTVEFPNEDPFFHNVFSLSNAAQFDLGRYPFGDKPHRGPRESRHRQGVLPPAFTDERRSSWCSIIHGS